MIERDLVIVGGGPAGMAAAIAAHGLGVKDILLLERDKWLGGILNQCIHMGFGLEYYKEALTGTQYAGRFANKIEKITSIDISLRSFAVKLTGNKTLTVIKPGSLMEIKAKAIIMATGCREKTREMINIPGTRPVGIFSAGLAQRMINIEGFLPGKKVVIAGSGDIGLIMARRFALEGAEVKAVIEIQDHTRGLTRNVVQCLEDFNIPLYFNSRISNIYGEERVEKVRVVSADGGLNGAPGGMMEFECDTVLISAGLIPENELIEMAGVDIDKKTNSPLTNELNTTSIPGIFVCGNSFKVYNIVDTVTRDSEAAGCLAAEYLRGLK